MKADLSGHGHVPYDVASKGPTIRCFLIIILFRLILIIRMLMLLLVSEYVKIATCQSASVLSFHCYPPEPKGSSGDRGMNTHIQIGLVPK
jgi:hypothetical protein